MFFRVSEVFSPEFLKTQNLQKNEKVIVIDGKDLDPILMKHKQLPASSKDFVFFYLQKQTSNKPYHRMIECRFIPPNSREACGCIFYDLFKLYDHMRGHLKEKSF